MPRQLPEHIRLERRITGRFHKALSRYQLIDNNDKILIGLSGGKDSLCLLELLGKRMRIQRPLFRAEAVHIRMENIKYQSDAEYLKDFAASYDIPLHVITTRFDDTNASSRKPACFLCSWYRRKQMFNIAQELGCNKIALGHHMDDIIHTALMNMFFQGHFSTMPIKLQMRKMPLTIIRPLCLESEADICEYARINCYKQQTKICPHEKSSYRTDMRRIFGEIEKLNEEARYSIWNSLETENKLIE